MSGVERVFLRLLNCETDHGLEELLKKFLIPVLLSLQSDKALFPKVFLLNIYVGRLV